MTMQTDILTSFHQVPYVKLSQLIYNKPVRSFCHNKATRFPAWTVWSWTSWYE